MHLIWGIDGADWSLLGDLRDDGRIPTLSGLIESGSCGTLRTTIPAFTGMAVPTLLTGKNPGTTGMVGFERVDGTLQDFTDTEDETLWEIAGRQGLATAAVGVRTTYPPRPVENGVLVSGDLYTPPDADDYVYPPSISEEIPSVASFHEDLATLDALQSAGDISAFLNAAIEATRTRHGVLQDILDATDPDLAMFWIGSADKLQHLAWDDRETLARYYEAIDDMLAKTLDRFEPEITYVVSDHGFEAVYERELHLNTWLRRQGYLATGWSALLSRYIGPIASNHLPNELTDTALSMATTLRDTLRSTSESGADPSGDSGGVRSVTVPGIDYERSRAVVANEWGVNVLAEGSERDELVEQLVDELRSLQIDGEPAFRFVARREDVYTRRHIEQYPDVVVLPSREYHLNHALSRTLTTQTGGSPHRSGYHVYNPNGVFVVSGHGIDRAEEMELAAEDFAPTVLHGLGVGVPNEVDGAPAREALPPNQREAEVTTIESSDPTMPEDRDRVAVDDDVENRLRDMGYL